MTLERISEDPEISEAMFEILETQKVLESHAHVTLLPPGGRDDQLAQLQLGSFSSPSPAPRPPPVPVPRRGQGST